MCEDLELFALLCRDVAQRPVVSSLEAEEARLLTEGFEVWLEAIALVFIFALDYFNRLDEAEEQSRQHEETVERLRLLQRQAEAAKDQANFSSESLQMLKAQAQEQQLRDLWRVLPILDDIQQDHQFEVAEIAALCHLFNRTE